MDAPELTSEVMKVADLMKAKAPYNPRKISDEALGGLRKSLKKWGVVQPIVFNKQTGNIVGGHQRVVALDAEQIEDAPVIVVDLSLPDEKALNITLNNPHIAGEFTDALQDLLKEINADDPKMFDDLNLDELLKSDAEPDVKDDDAGEPPEKPVTQPGQIWLLGDHRLICGDSTDPKVIAALMGDEKAACVITDPPYGVDYVGKTKEKLTIKNDDKAGLPELLKAAFTNTVAQCHPGACWYVFAPAGRMNLPFAQALLDLDIWRQTLMWVKNSLVLGQTDYHYRHEEIFYGWAPGAKHKPPPDRKQDSVWEFDRPTKSKLHPTMKPIPMLAHALDMSTAVGSVVLDPFAGSGSTMSACEQTGRKARCVELDPGYCDVIVERWKKLSGEEPKLAE